MTDNRTKLQRSYNMSCIRSVNTKPEILVRKFLFSNGIRYRLHSGKLKGKPDIVINKIQTVVFVNGCFWHGHKDCNNSKTPESNRVFWVNKIKNNIKRDRENCRILRKEGWNVIVIWECELSVKKIEKTFSKLLKKLY